MKNRIPFVGRDIERDSFKEWVQISSTETQIVFISGQGGIGKSRLLEEVYTEYKQKPNLRVLESIDFTDLKLRVAENVIRAIVDKLEPAHFKGYFEEQRKFNNVIRNKRLSPSYQKILEQNMFVAFISEYNTLAEEKCIILMFDTLDALQTQADERDIWNYLKKLITNLNNTLFVFTGRNAKEYYNKVKNNNRIDNKNLHHIPLVPFGEGDSIKYFDYKVEQLYNPLSSETREFLLKQAHGKPILIDLAVEMWLEHNLQIPTPNRFDTDEEKGWEIFEKALVEGLFDRRNPEDRVILTLAHATELTFEGMAYILKPSIDKIQLKEIWEKLGNLVSIKILPGRRITLHDEVQRMIDKYVFPDFDPQGSWRRRRSTELLDFYAKDQKKRKEKLNELQELANTTSDIAIFSKLDATQSELWHTNSLYLGQALFANIQKGLALFWGFIKQIEDEKLRTRIQERLVDVIYPRYYRKINQDQKCKIVLKKSTCLFERQKHSDVINLINERRSDFDQDSKYYFDLLNREGNSLLRLGELGEGVRLFERALTQATRNDLKAKLILANLALGWGKRLQGNWHDATNSYKTALNLQYDTDDTTYEAFIQNNLAHTYSLSKPTLALEYCDLAIGIWTESNDRKGLIMAYTNKGALLYRVNRYEDARYWFEQTQKIAEPDDIDLSNINKTWLGTTYWAKAQGVHLSDKEKEELLQKAESLLTEVRESPDLELYEKPLCTNRLARVYKSQGKFDKALNLFKESYNRSLHMGDMYNQIVSLRDWSELALEQEYSDRYEYLVEKIASYEKVVNLDKIPHKGAFGEAIVYSGLMTICNETNSEDGQEIVERGLDELIYYANSINYSFTKSMHKFKNLAENALKQDQRKELGNWLLSLKKVKDLRQKHPLVYQIISQL